MIHLSDMNLQSTSGLHFPFLSETYDIPYFHLQNILKVWKEIKKLSSELCITAALAVELEHFLFSRTPNAQPVGGCFHQMPVALDGSQGMSDFCICHIQKKVSTVIMNLYQFHT